MARHPRKETTERPPRLKSTTKALSADNRRLAAIAHHRARRKARDGQKTQLISLRMPVALLARINDILAASSENGQAPPTLSEFLIDVISFNLGVDEDAK